MSRTNNRHHRNHKQRKEEKNNQFTKEHIINEPDIHIKKNTIHIKNRVKSPHIPLKNFSEQNSSYWMYGKHSIIQALQNPNRKIISLAITEKTTAELEKIVSHLPPDKKFIALEKLEKIEIIKCNDKGDYYRVIGIKNPEITTQNIAARVIPLEQPELGEILQKNSNLIMLDKVHDPHNIGAIARSAAAFGFGAIVVPRDGSPEESAVIAKSAVGALESVPYIMTTNLVRAMKEAKSQGYLLIGLDGDATEIAEKVLFELNTIIKKKTSYSKNTTQIAIDETRLQNAENSISQENKESSNFPIFFNENCSNNKKFTINKHYYPTASEADKIDSHPATIKKIFILGNEGKGMRHLVKQNCDIIVKINMSSQMESLNVSNAAAIIMHLEYMTCQMGR